MGEEEEVRVGGREVFGRGVCCWVVSGEWLF